MITDEQFKNLKPGDTLVLEITVAEIALGRIYYNGTNCMDCCYPDEVSLPPKYDPCRKFKAGDVVEYVEVNGRDYKDAPPLGKQCRVFKEETDGFVVVTYLDFNCLYRHEVPFYHLQLVTPVEELEPYSVVQPENYKCVRIMKEKRIHSSIPFDEEECVCLTLEEAKAAAEAECARLNAEYRKEQK